MPSEVECCSLGARRRGPRRPPSNPPQSTRLNANAPNTRPALGAASQHDTRLSDWQHSGIMLGVAGPLCNALEISMHEVHLNPEP